jgi:hypothetical protein
LFVDYDHAGNLMTRSSRTGYVQMVNISVISWHSKIQDLVVGTTFASESVAAKVAMEANQAL